MFSGFEIALFVFIYIIHFYIWIIYVAHLIADFHLSNDPQKKINLKEVFILFFPIISIIYLICRSSTQKKITN